MNASPSQADLDAVLKRHEDILDAQFQRATILPGWANVLDEVLVEWKRFGGPKILRIKEKLGTLRITGVDQAHPAARRLRQWAMERTGMTCEICGNPGQPMAKEGYRATRCQGHPLE